MSNPQDFLLDIAFPKFCFGCTAEGSYLCLDCRSLLDIMEHTYCLCTKPLQLASDSGKCPSCKNKTLNGLSFAVAYQALPIKKLIHQVKYPPYVKDAIPVAASLLIEHFVKAGKNGDSFWSDAVLVPVPMDIRKQKLRGYNQAELLAREISSVANVPLVTNVLVKTKSTPPQMESSKEERETNLIGVFACKNAAPLAGKKVFLVDDVYTTGSTLTACAEVLKESGAKSVWGITLAREEWK